VNKILKIEEKDGSNGFEIGKGSGKRG